MKFTRILTLALAIAMLICSVAMADEFPIVDEPTTLHIYAKTAAYYPEQDLGQTSAMKKYAEMTGVTIEWENIDADVFTNQLAALISSGDKLPDIIFKGNLGNSRLNDWGAQGILIDLYPYLEEYAPNFWALMEQEDTIGGAILTEDGKVYGLPQVILGAEMRTPTKMWMNQKALAAVDAEEPWTTEEFYETMKAILASDWNGNGEADEVGVVASVGNLHNYFYGSFGLRNRGAHHDVVDVDPETGDLRVFATSENYREYLEYMKLLYDEKIIYPEIFTEGDKQASVLAASERLTVLFNTTAPSVGAELEKDWNTVNHSLMGPEGFASHTQTRAAIHSCGNFVITDSCPEELIPVALKWVDYFYTEEGSRLLLVGVEGQDWEIKADGSMDWTDAAYATRGENMADNAFRAQFGLWPAGAVPGCFYSNLFSAEYSAKPAACAQALLKDYAPEKIWPMINYTEEETKMINDINNDINDYVKAQAALIITGELELTDEWWEGFKAEIENIGAETLLEGYRLALTRVYGEDADF